MPEKLHENHLKFRNSIAQTPKKLNAFMLAQAYTPEGLDRLIAQYCEAYHGIYGTITEDMSADEQRDVFMKYVEEICADAYAGIRRGGINTVKAEQAMAAFRSDRTDGGRQTAAATERTNGPGENKTAGLEADGEARYSAEEEEDYKKPITEQDIQVLRGIERKSINAFSSEEVKMTSKWAYKFFKEIGTKSPFFRRAFGEWRAHDISSVNVIDMEARRGKNPRGTFVNKDTGWKISSSSVGYDETISHSGKDKKSIIAMRNIDSIIEQAVLFDTEVSEYGRGKKSVYTALMHNLYAMIRIDGVPYIAKMTVDESHAPGQSDTIKKFYHVRSIKVETISSVGIGESHTPIMENTVSSIKIAQLYDFVKQYDSDFTPAREVNPALLNDDGTPRVFYHGTLAKGITEFKKEYIGSRYAADDVGFFFIDNEKIAKDYSVSEFDSEKRGEVIPAYLCMERPLVLNAEYAKKNGYGNIFKSNDAIDVWDNFQQAILDDAQDMNADGIIIDDGTNRMAVTFDPMQAKHAEENIGTFDGEDSRLRFSVEDDAAEYDED